MGMDRVQFNVFNANGGCHRTPGSVTPFSAVDMVVVSAFPHGNSGTGWAHRHPRRTPRPSAPRHQRPRDHPPARLILLRFDLERGIELARRAADTVERGAAGYMLLTATT